MPEDNKHTQSLEHESDVQANDPELDLRQYLITLRKHRWPTLAFVAIVTAAAWWVANNMTPIYRATSELLIEEKGTNRVAIQDIFDGSLKDQDYYHTQYEVLRSRRLAKRVMEKLDLYEHPEFHTTQDKLATVEPVQQGEAIVETDTVERQIAVDRFMGKLIITPVKKTKLVSISFESKDPVLAAQVANAVADGYIVNYMDTRMEMSESATAWLTEKLSGIKLQLTQAQERLLNYKEQHGLIDAGGGVGGLNEQQVGIVTSKLLEAQRAAAESDILRNEIRQIGGTNVEGLLSLPMIGSNPLVGQYKLARQDVQFMLDELSNRYGDKHPKVVDAKSRLQTAQSNLRQQILNIVDTIEKDYKLNQQSVASLQQRLDNETGKIQAVDRTRMELITLEHEVEANRKLYDTFFSRIREVDEAQDMSSSNAQISEHAEVPLMAVKPHKSLIVLLAGLLSLGFSVLCAVLYETMDSTINSTTDVEDKLRLRMLGIIPMVDKKKLGNQKGQALVPGSHGRDLHHFEESIRTIRTGVCLDDLQKKQQVVMVTSALPGEGKSTLASHLAHSFSQLDRVLLIECDMRRPSLHRAFDFGSTGGLSDLLNGSVPFSDCINLSVVDDLDVIPAGSIPDKPLELLSSKRFEHLIEQMKKRYDRIVIDSAPVQAVSDALILGQYADTVIFTVRASATSHVVAERGVSRLVQAGIKVAGAVVTCVNIEKISGYGGELQYQGYYDYYGYSDDERNFARGKSDKKVPEKIAEIA